MIIPGHPNNTGQKPILIGKPEQVENQLNYIYRGNYGLQSEEELIACGVSPEMAKEYMRIKLAFAFGSIKPSSDLLDSCYVSDTETEVKNGVMIKRQSFNQYEFSFKGEKVSVDLSLPPDQQYESTYDLGYYQVNPGYFSVIHSGEGDAFPLRPPIFGI